MHAFVISLYPSGQIWRVRILCPYCGKIHQHGAGNRTEAPNLGFRGSHCNSGDYELTVDSGSNVVGLPSDNPLVVAALGDSAIGAGNVPARQLPRPSR